METRIPYLNNANDTAERTIRSRVIHQSATHCGDPISMPGQATWHL